MTAIESVELDGAAIRYTDIGSGPPVVFVHGAYVTGALWDDVVDRLAVDYRCIAPTWPFGAQEAPVGDVDLGVRAAGRRIAGLLDALDLKDVTLVSNDTGGGIVLSALGDSTLNFDRVSRLVFTNCDSFEHFPPKSFAPIVKLCSASAMGGRLVLGALASGPGLKFFASSVTGNGIPAERLPTIFGGFRSSAAVRREAVRFSADLNSRYTLGAAGALAEWSKPVLLAWGTDDKMFPMAHAQRLADAFPDAVLHPIADSSTYVMIDRPDETSSAIEGFVAK